jgi:hypothetical protein
MCLIKQITYDSWFPLFGINKSLILRRIILGNPLKLINDVAPYDIPAVMFLPLELVIRELPATASGPGGTDIIYVSLSLPLMLVGFVDREWGMGYPADVFV